MKLITRVSCWVLTFILALVKVTNLMTFPWWIVPVPVVFDLVGNALINIVRWLLIGYATEYAQVLETKNEQKRQLLQRLNELRVENEDMGTVQIKKFETIGEVTEWLEANRGNLVPEEDECDGEDVQGL